MFKQSVLSAVMIVVAFLMPIPLAAAPQTDTKSFQNTEQTPRPAAPSEKNAVSDSAVAPILIYHSVREYRRTDSAASSGRACGSDRTASPIPIYPG
jgi:hypothetical protein